MSGTAILVLCFGIIFLLTILGWGAFWFQRQKRDHELRLREEIWLYRSKANELGESCERRLSILAPCLYQSLLLTHEVWDEPYGFWPWERRVKIVLSARIRERKDLETVRQIVRGVVSTFRTEPTNQRYRVEIQILPLDEKGMGATQ